jgi:DNA-directed RNA polymerase subunit M/transcription elongation factor TFIIS
MESNIAFCPKCETHMVYKGSLLECLSCSYVEEVKTITKLMSTVYKANASSRIDSSTIYDPCIRRTYKIDCINTECPSNDITQWGKRTNDGILIQPDTILVNYHDKVERRNTYICRICKSST